MLLLSEIIKQHIGQCRSQFHRHQNMSSLAIMLTHTMLEHIYTRKNRLAKRRRLPVQISKISQDQTVKNYFNIKYINLKESLFTYINFTESSTLNLNFKID